MKYFFGEKNKNLYEIEMDEGRALLIGFKRASERNNTIELYDCVRNAKKKDWRLTQDGKYRRLSVASGIGFDKVDAGKLRRALTMEMIASDWEIDIKAKAVKIPKDNFDRLVAPILEKRNSNTCSCCIVQ